MLVFAEGFRPLCTNEMTVQIKAAFCVSISSSVSRKYFDLSIAGIQEV